jgi:hypothetical protein
MFEKKKNIYLLRLVLLCFFFFQIVSCGFACFLVFILIVFMLFCLVSFCLAFPYILFLFFFLFCFFLLCCVLLVCFVIVVIVIVDVITLAVNVVVLLFLLLEDSYQVSNVKEKANASGKANTREKGNYDANAKKNHGQEKKKSR